MVLQGSGVMVKVCEPPQGTETLPDGLMLPPDPALAVIVYVPETLKEADTVWLDWIFVNE